MEKGAAVDDDEVVVHAFMPPSWDEENRRATPSAFLGQDVSVSRLSVFTYERIVDIFRDDFDGRLRGTGQAVVSHVKQQAEMPLETGKLPKFFLRVLADPTEKNPAHAVIHGVDRNDPTKAREIRTRTVAQRLLKLFGVTPV